MADGLLALINSSDFSNPFQVAVFLFLNGGWIVVLFAFVLGIWWAYLTIIRERYDARQPQVLLAIDVPKDSEQTPKAMEQAFSHLYGIKKEGNLIEKYVEGYTQACLSFELISIDGYIQFLVRTPAKFRDMVEAAIYAQYPTAEITEVEDYVTDIPWRYPNEDYQMWGTEFRFTRPSVYPIRTYPQFEHPLTQTFLDPMASLLEILSHLRAGEQVWLQWVIQPADDSWRESGLRLIKKLIGAKVEGSSGGLATVPGNVAQGVYETLTASLFAPGEASKAKQDKSLPSLMQHLPPNERAVIESVGMKISKLGWVTRFRYVYVSRKELYDSSRNAAVMGAVQQFNSLDLNSFRPNKKSWTKLNYFFVDRRTDGRRRKLMWRYQQRSTKGQPGFILNTEEIATVYHFPVITVKAPLVKKVEARRGEPPASLPVISDLDQPLAAPSPTSPYSAPPTNLPSP